MSAPDHATPLGKQGWLDSDGEPIQAGTLPDVECQCGWHGHVTELLGVDPDENSTMWCPQCTCATWEYS